MLVNPIFSNCGASLEISFSYISRLATLSCVTEREVYYYTLCQLVTVARSWARHPDPKIFHVATVDREKHDKVRKRTINKGERTIHVGLSRREFWVPEDF